MYTHNWTSSKYIVLILYFKLFYHLILLKYSNFIIHAIVSKEKRFILWKKKKIITNTIFPKFFPRVYVDSREVYSSQYKHRNIERN